MYDVFLSYPHARAPEAASIAAALRARSLDVWVDESDIPTFASITRSIAEGLARSKVLVAYYAAEYASSRACQWELAAAYLAAARDADPRRRILVVNPEPEALHIQPVELRDALFVAIPGAGNQPALDHLAADVEAHVKALAGTLGDVEPLEQPQWYGSRSTGSTRFVGRLADLWRLHSALHARDAPVITGAAGSALALVQGMGGVGKSLLAEEYAVRFAAAHPGGVFWLRAFGNDETRVGLGREEREAERGRQLRAVAEALGLPVDGRPLGDVESHLARELGERGQPFLWVVDDVPSGLGHDSLVGWLAPHPLGRTLVTTRSREYGALGVVVALGVLDPDAAYELLTHAPGRRAPIGEGEELAARAIVERLGGHALAVDVAAALLRLQSYADVLAELNDPTRDALELARDLAGVLPNGHEPAVAATLLQSLTRLGPEGRDFLRLAAGLAVAPIPAALVERVFEAADGLPVRDARSRAMRALHQADLLSLTEPADAGPGVAAVHTLVTRTVQFHDAEPRRRESLRAAAVAVLTMTLPRRAEDSHQHLDLLVAHARELARTSDDLSGLALRDWVATFDFVVGAYASAEAICRQQYELRQRLQGGTHPDTLTAMNNLAEMRRHMGDLPGARRLLDSLVETSRRVLGETHPHTLTALNNLALTMRAAGDLPGARTLLERVVGHLGQVPDEWREVELTVRNNLAETLQAIGDVAGARRLLERVREISVRTRGERDRVSLIATQNLGLALHAQGETPAARALLEQVVEAYTSMWGDGHPDTLRALGNLATTLEAQGELAGARALEERVVAGCRQRLGDSHPDTLWAMNNLASTLRAQGDFAASRALMEQVLDATRRVLGETHSRTLASAWNLFILAVQMNDAAAARTTFERDLLWLMQRDPEVLDSTAQAIRAEIVALRQPAGLVSRVRGWLRRWGRRH